MAVSLLRVCFRLSSNTLEKCSTASNFIISRNYPILTNVSEIKKLPNKFQSLPQESLFLPVVNRKFSIAVICFGKSVADRKKQEYDVSSDSDSDSDSGEKRYEKGNSEFWRRKMRTFHGLLDLNKDGVVSLDDFKLLSERFINLGHLSQQQEKEFLVMLQVVWEEQWGVVHPYNTVTTEQYLENMHHVVNDKSLKRKAHKFLPYLFKAVDQDKNGNLSVEEFKLFFQCLGLDNEVAIYSFASIDVNKDGLLSEEEFVKLGREFFLTEDETKPSKLFWGPLIKP